MAGMDFIEFVKPAPASDKKEKKKKK